MTFNVDGNLNTVLLFVLGVVVATLVFARLANPDRLLDRVIYGFILLVLLVAYAIWRSTETLPPFELSARAIWPYVFYTFEMIAILSGIGYVLILTRTTDWSAEADAAERELERSGRYPAVDVFICTYDEPLNVLEKSIVAARSMSYPRFTVHVCDDTGRPEVRDYCSKLGVRYLTRPDNFQAKAGNLNNALRYTNLRAAPSDLIMVLDADFAPEERFLDRVVGLFRDPRIGIVQTPQFFYNSDPLQHNLGINRVFTDEQRVFFDKAQPSKDVDGCAFCVGTSFVARRSAINAIGGFPGDVITEDLWLTYRLMENGYVTRWLNEKLSVGLSAEGIAEYITQRTRWCHGTFQIAMLKNGPLLGGRYTPLQRLHFLHGILHWLSKPYLICILLAPTVFWLFGVPAIQADELLFLKYRRPSHFDALFDQQRVTAVKQFVEHVNGAGKSRDCRSRGRILRNADMRCEHAGVETRLVGDPAAAVDEGIDQLAVGHRRQLFPARRVAARLGGDRQIVHRHHHERHAGVPDRDVVVFEADLVRFEPQRHGDRLLADVRMDRTGEPRQVELGKSRLAGLQLCNGTHRTDALFKDIHQVHVDTLAAGLAFGKRHRRAHRGMAGERQFPPRRENTQPRAVGRVVGRQDEHRFRQVELAGDLLHAFVREPFRIEHHRQRIAGQSVG